MTPTQEQAWRARLAPYYTELGVDPASAARRTARRSATDMCDGAHLIRPKVVSFHFGLPGARTRGER